MMANEPSASGAMKSSSTEIRSPRQVMESLTEHIRGQVVDSNIVGQLLGELNHSVDHCFSQRESDRLLQEALLEAPWLTADAEALKQRRAHIRETLQALQAEGTEVTQGTGRFAERFQSLVEDYLEYESSEHELLEAAFPGPDWIEGDL